MEKRKTSEIGASRGDRKRQQDSFLKDSATAFSKEDESGNKKIKIDGANFIDTAGGFLIDERDIIENEIREAEKIAKLFEQENNAEEVPLTYFTCLECEEQFVESYLQKNFDFSCCDKCKDLSGSHELITKTTARDEYLLKDCDFDYREPALKFIARPNPNKPSWAEMKLYLRSQVKARALEVHGSLEEIKNKKETREEKRQIGKIKKFNKELNELRKSVRSSLYDKRLKPNTHEHEFGPSTYNEETDEYYHECKCGYSETYEEL